MPKKIKAIRKYKLKSGREKYEFSIRANKNKIIHRRGFATYDEAQLAYLNFKQQIINGDIDAELKRVKYNDLYEQWLKRYSNTVKESTYNKTMNLFNLHILPNIGDYYLNDITVQQCQAAIDSWAETLVDYKLIATYASKIFKEAQRFDLIIKNPFDKVTIPRTTKHVKMIYQKKQHRHNYYNRKQLNKFLDTAKKYMPTEVYTFFRLLAYTGLRRGEILVLTWNDIDLINKTLKVNKTLAYGVGNKRIIQTPKSQQSNRTIVLDNVTIEILKKWQKIQKAMLQVKEISANQVVFQSPNNKAYTPDTPNVWLKRIIKLADLPSITLHGFRHTHATLLYNENPYINPKDVQKRLGHADFAVTMNIYEHATDDSDSKILKAIDKLNSESDSDNNTSGR
ncbi:site-specific integrase [Bombilactobacillus bombi]|uniref:Site-specific integrase n=1 Tax=Bombilactobacillus bombi TaxID=1303590 RepID=A0A3R6VAH3_9LACO|nr:site-specific integrase [Bombilactobacillus bombi]RHW51286.1 site-specific integrase [Bombilactobacillus bombi]